MHPSKKSFLAQSTAGYIAIFNSERPWRLNRTKRFEGHQVLFFEGFWDLSPNK